MSCTTCSSKSGTTPAGCKSNGQCMTDGGCSKLDVTDWLSGMAGPASLKDFPLLEVRFKGARKEFYLNSDAVYLEQGDAVTVETAVSGAGNYSGTANGFDLGHVTLTGELVRLQLKKKNISFQSFEGFKKILRKASATDIEKWKVVKGLEDATMHKARNIALELNLSMKLSDVEYQADKHKATFYYTAEDRVDFRELIRRLADEFKVRIEMRQIGMRQEASRLGGIGSCGRELCCSTWLTDFKSVNTSAARYQNLSLNTLKLAGQCGKLKCCLNYELDNYLDALKGIPERVDHIETLKGTARLQKTDIFKKIMWFSYPGEENWIPVPVARVIFLRDQLLAGIKLADIQEETHAKPPRILDYNQVEQDSITRLDDGAKKKKRLNRNKKKRT